MAFALAAVPSRIRNWAWRILREHEGIVSGCKVNRLIARLYGERCRQNANAGDVATGSCEALD
jgi:hypothetical protein